MNKLSYDGPIVLAVLDGVGLAPDGPGNAVSRARTPFLGKAASEYFHVALDASGEAVGLAHGQIGSSEVGHNTIGTGKANLQDAARVDAEFASGRIFDSKSWKESILRTKNSGTLHFAGIFSDGGVHSDINHLMKMVARAYEEGVRHMRIHAVLDGRDTPPQTEPKFIKRFEEFAKGFIGADIKIADGGGRSVYVSDRYENDWNVVARGWDAMVNGEADYYFESAEDAIATLRRIDPKVQDQDLPPFVITKGNQPVGKIEKGDVLIYFDFRKDRAIEIAQAFTYWDFPYFNRGNYTPDQVYFVGMCEYNSDTHVPEHRLVEPVAFGETLPHFLGTHNISQLACSETLKFGHVTYYFNGNSYDKQPGEEHIEIESSKEYPASRPWMKTAEITDAVLDNLNKYKFIRLNYPGGDMVGHTADINATIIALEAIDLSLARLAKELDKLGGVLIIVSDHGNAEELLDEKNQPKTAHTLNKVPCIIYDNTANRTKYAYSNLEHPGLSNLTATIATLLGFTKPELPEAWDPSLIVTV